MAAVMTTFPRPLIRERGQLVPGGGAVSREVEAFLSVEVPLRVLARRPEAGVRPAPVLLGMHGYGMDAGSFLAVLAKAAPPAFLVLSLQGPHSTLVTGVDDPETKRGFHWGVSPRAEDNRLVHRRAVAAALAWAAANGGDRGRTVLAGFSQPCSFNYRLAADPADGVAFAGVLAFCGGVPGEWTGPGEPTAASAATDVLHVSTNQDPYYPESRIAPYAEILASRFRSVAHRRYDGRHHVPSRSFADVRAFLEAHG
jgi:predicted esterase